MLAALVIIAALAANAPLHPPTPSGRYAQAEKQPDASNKRQSASAHERGTESAPLVVQIAQPEGHEAIATKTEGEPEGYANPDWWVAGATIALAVVTGGLWWVTYLLWSSTKNLVTEERDTRRIELRAYLSAKPKGVTWDGKMFRALVDIENGGQTPAFNVKIPAVWELNHPAPHTFDVAEAGNNDQVMAGIVPFTLPSGGINNLSPKSEITDFDAIRAQAKIGWFYVFGLITYKDVFGDEHWVEFCAYLTGAEFLAALALALKAQGEKIGVPFKIAGFGNDASFNPDHAEAMKKHNAKA